MTADVASVAFLAGAGAVIAADVLVRRLSRRRRRFRLVPRAVARSHRAGHPWRGDDGD